MKKVAALTAAVLVLAGCSSNDDKGATAPNTIWPHHVTLPDGRTVLCVYERQGYSGGPSCDWASAK